MSDTSTNINETCKGLSNYKKDNIQFILADNKTTKDILNGSTSNISKHLRIMRKYILDLLYLVQCLTSYTESSSYRPINIHLAKHHFYTYTTGRYL